MPHSPVHYSLDGLVIIPVCRQAKWYALTAELHLLGNLPLFLLLVHAHYDLG